MFDVLRKKKEKRKRHRRHNEQTIETRLMNQHRGETRAKTNRCILDVPLLDLQTARRRGGGGDGGESPPPHDATYAYPSTYNVGIRHAMRCCASRPVSALRCGGGAAAARQHDLAFQFAQRQWAVFTSLNCNHARAFKQQIVRYFLLFLVSNRYCSWCSCRRAAPSASGAFDLLGETLAVHEAFFLW